MGKDVYNTKYYGHLIKSKFWQNYKYEIIFKKSEILVKQYVYKLGEEG